jgi:hypothetical protein
MCQLNFIVKPQSGEKWTSVRIFGKFIRLAQKIVKNFGFEKTAEPDVYCNKDFEISLKLSIINSEEMQLSFIQPALGSEELEFTQTVMNMVANTKLYNIFAGKVSEDTLVKDMIEKEDISSMQQGTSEEVFNGPYTYDLGSKIVNA